MLVLVLTVFAEGHETGLKELRAHSVRLSVYVKHHFVELPLDSLQLLGRVALERMEEPFKLVVATCFDD